MGGSEYGRLRTRWWLAVAVPVVLSLLPVLALLASMVTDGATPLSLSAAVAASLVAALVVVTRPRTDQRVGPVRVRAIAYGVRAWHAAFLRLRDPNAPGRARPRAPSAV